MRVYNIVQIVLHLFTNVLSRESRKVFRIVDAGAVDLRTKLCIADHFES
jgi:hypothetical protein